MATWAGVVRVSHMGERRVGADDFHADRQQIAAIEGAVPRGDRLDILPPELDVSGGLPLERRPSLLAAVEGVERGQYAGIIVAYLSRLGRNVREQLRAWDRVEEAGGRIIVVQEGIDTSTPTGRLQRTVLLGIAEHERELHAERFENLRRWATEAGIWQRRQTPLGYDRDPETRRLVPNVQADLVRFAFANAPTMPVTDIAEHLGMTTSGVRHILRNRVYLGELRVGSHVNRDAHEPLVGHDTFEVAQLGRSRRTRTFGPPALLAGLVRCAGCGHVMSRTNTRILNYQCRKRHSGGVCPAPAAVTLEHLDRHVEVIALAELERLSIQAAQSGDVIADARDAVSRAEREMSAYLDAVSAADVGADAFRSGAQQRRAAVDDARAALHQVLALQTLPPEFKTGAEVWNSLDAQGRNALLRGLLEAVVVRRAGGRGTRAALADRVQVVAFGAGVVPVKRGEVPYGVRPLWLDADDERVLGVPRREDAL